MTTPALWTDEGEPHPAWTTPATEEDYATAAKHLLAAVEPEASDQRSKMIYRLLRTREYSRAELLLVMKELPFDPDASHNYGKGLNPADIERIVEENRQTRRRLTRPMDSETRDEFITEHGADPDAFHCCGFDKYDEPLWRYAPNPDTKREDIDPSPKEPRPELPEDTPGASRQESDTGEAPASFKDLVQTALDDSKDEDAPS
ncbi:hypothetical protein [Salinibacter phage 6_8]